LSTTYFAAALPSFRVPDVPYLRGETVTLRTIERNDVDFPHEMIDDPELWRGFGAPVPVVVRR